MSQVTPDTAAAQIVQLLSTLDVSAISTHKDLRSAVLDLIERSAKDFRDEVLQRIDSNKRRRKNTNEHTPEEAQLLSYLAEHNCSVTASSKQVVQRLARALKGLHSNLHIETDAFQIPNDKTVGQLSHTTSFVRTSGCRQARIMQHYNMCAQTTHVTEGWRRLYMLWVIYEVDRLMFEKSDVAYAEREFCRLSGESEKVIREIRTVSRSYMTAANREDGLGIILMLGSKTTDAWERGRTFGDDAVSWLWASCISKHSQLGAKAKALQRVACAVIRQGFLEYDIESAELLEEGHVFTRHFRAEEASRDSLTGLQRLVAAADQVEAYRSGCPSDVAQCQPARDTQAQQQLGARNEGLIAGQVLGSVPSILPHSPSETGPGVPSQFDAPSATPTTNAATARSCGHSDQQITHLSFSALDPYTGRNLTGAQDGGPTRVGASTRASLVNQDLGNGNTLQAQWQQYTDPNWTQHLAGSEIPLDNAFNPPQDQFGQVDVALRQYSGGFLPEAWLDDLARAGGFGT